MENEAEMQHLLTKKLLVFDNKCIEYALRVVTYTFVGCKNFVKIQMNSTKKDVLVRMFWHFLSSVIG